MSEELTITAALMGGEVVDSGYNFTGAPRIAIRFPNDYGVDIISGMLTGRNIGCYAESGEYEVAVIDFTPNPDGDNEPSGYWLCYDTPIEGAYDVIGHLLAEQVQVIMQQVAALPPRITIAPKSAAHVRFPV